MDSFCAELPSGEGYGFPSSCGWEFRPIGWARVRPCLQKISTMTVTTFAIILFAVSLVAGYLLIVHRALSGGAANDPSFDALAPQPRSEPKPAQERAPAGRPNQISKYA